MVLDDFCRSTSLCIGVEVGPSVLDRGMKIDANGGQQDQHTRLKHRIDAFFMKGRGNLSQC